MATNNSGLVWFGLRRRHLTDERQVARVDPVEATVFQISAKIAPAGKQPSAGSLRQCGEIHKASGR